MLAKEATDEDTGDRIKIPMNDWKVIFKKEMYNKTRKRLEREGTYKSLKYFNTFTLRTVVKPGSTISMNQED